MASVVIKVKFGETLRRFNASISDMKLDLDISMFREKIRRLFNFGSDVDFTMTYVDEDGDVVTLADDDDLHDVVRQSLNPVRITVNLNNSNYNGSSGNSTPMRSQNQLPFQTLNSGVSEFLNSVPEPLREVLAKLPLDLASKASSSAPAVTELVEKMKAVYLNQLASPGMHPPTVGPSNVNSGHSKVQVNPEAASENSKEKEKQVHKVTEGVKFKDVPPPRGMDLNVPYFEYESFQAPVNSTKSVGGGSTGKGKNTTDGVEKKKEFGSEKKDGISSESLNKPWKSNLYQMSQHLEDGMVAQAAAAAQCAQVAADINKNSNDSGSSLDWAQGMVNATNQGPFFGMPLTVDPVTQGHHRHSRSHHWKRHGLVNNGIGAIFHMGVRCDGCGVYPITGPRFKSKVKDNYDLCNVCFAGMGNATDYIRIDRPTTGFRRHHMPFKGFYDPSLNIPPPTLPHAMRAPGSKLPRSKLDSRFILDVNVLDGTIMTPFTAFTKIWRMRNNGTVTWPHGSQLHWIGGDRLSISDSVDVEIPVDGLPVEKELDIAVDFTAPELPGRYVSYWRMASPSGQKFGQRVWVLIQVDASMEDLGETSINLNLPPVRNPEVVDQDPLMDSILSGNNIIKVTDSGSTSVELLPKDDEMNFPINDSLIIDNGGGSSTMATLSAPPVASSSPVYNSTQVGTALASLPAGPTFSSGLYPTVGSDTEPISYPMVDFSVMPPAMVSGAPLSSPTGAVVQPLCSSSRKVSDEQEQALVKDLEEMGFKQRNLNTEILRMNNYDMEKSIDDLCGVLEWDPMLDELQEMGFADDEANRRLLKKNNGSIKRVVIDLINGERA